MKCYQLLLTALLSVAIFGGNAEAQYTRSQAKDRLVGLKVNPEVAILVAELSTGVAVLPNSVFLKGRNAADTANVDLLKIDSGDNTEIGSASSKSIELAPGGGLAMTLNSSGHWIFSATTMKVLSDDSDGADNSSQCLSAGGDCDNSRGAYLQMTGNEHAAVGDLTLAAGNGTAAKIDLNAGSSSSTINFNLGAGLSNVLAISTTEVQHQVDSTFITGKTISIQEATAASKCMGSGTHNGTTAVTVSTTCAATGARIFLTDTSDPTGSTAAQCWVTNIVNGTSFDVDCDQANDATFSYLIVHEAP